MNACRMMSLSVGHWFSDCRRRFARDLVHLAVAPGDGADDRRRAGQVRDVAGELARPMHGERLRLVAGEIDDLDLARLDDEKVRVAIAT